MSEIVHDWTSSEIAEASIITTSDLIRALELIREASPELADMINAEEQEP